MFDSSISTLTKFRFLGENDVAPYALVTLTTFGSFFASLTEFPIALSAPPYSLAVGLIGVAYLPQVNVTPNL